MGWSMLAIDVSRCAAPLQGGLVVAQQSNLTHTGNRTDPVMCKQGLFCLSTTTPMALQSYCQQLLSGNQSLRGCSLMEHHACRTPAATGGSRQCRRWAASFRWRRDTHAVALHLAAQPVKGQRSKLFRIHSCALPFPIHSDPSLCLCFWLRSHSFGRWL